MTKNQVRPLCGSHSATFIAWHIGGSSGGGGVMIMTAQDDDQDDYYYCSDSPAGVD